MAQYVWLSHVFSQQMPRYRGEGECVFESIKIIGHAGSESAKMRVSFDSHMGTHVDAPAHFIPLGKTIDQIPPAFLVYDRVGLLRVTQRKEMIIPEMLIDLDMLSDEIELLLIKTGMGLIRDCDAYQTDYPFFSPELADFFSKSFPRLRAVGVDCLSIQNPCASVIGREAHRQFLSREILLIEDMDLSHIDKSPDHVIVAPLRLMEGDGAPATIFGVYE